LSYVLYQKFVNKILSKHNFPINIYLKKLIFKFWES